MVSKLYTKEDLIALCHQVGIYAGDTVLVHDHPLLHTIRGKGISALEALKEVVGLEGTIVVSEVLFDTFEPGLDRDIPFINRKKIRDQLVSLSEHELLFGYSPLFQAMLNQPQVYVSHHPHVKLAAVGKFAKYITRATSLHFPFSETSPFQTLMELNAKILYFGQEMGDCHELRLGCAQDSHAIMVNGYPSQQEWKMYLDYEYDPKRYEQALLKTRKKQTALATCVSYQEALATYRQQNEHYFIENK